MINAHPKLVSVCIPTYCRGELLDQAIASVLKQNYINFELIISDNASNDNIKDRVDKYKDRRIKLILQPRNIGMVKNFNASIAASSGDIIKPLCDDDLLHPNCLELIVNSFSTSSDVQMVVFEDIVIQESNHPIWPSVAGVSQNTIPKGIRKDSLSGRAVTPTHVAFTRKLWTEIGPYNDEIMWSFDWDFFVRAISKIDIQLLSIPLCAFRIWNGSSTVSSKDILRNYRELEITLKYLLKEHPYHRDVVKQKIYSEIIKYIPTVIKHSYYNVSLFREYFRISNQLITLLK